MSTNPFQDYAQFAWQIQEEERERDLSPNRLRRPLGEMQKHVTEREIELQRHRAAALAAGRKTGHDQSEVERRVVALFELCERLLLWERDAPRLTPDQLRQRESSACWTDDPACNYLISLLNQFAGPWQQISDLADAYEGAVSAGRGRGEATEQTEATGELPALMSAPDLARALRQPVSRVDSFLRRYRETHPDCFSETDSPRRHEPRRLYRVAVVWPALQAQLPKWQK
ncbi:MAG TPA: hypothetical protein VH575_28350 [Gemmataceae bacterium]|jgi:hypothetical protein